MARRRAVERAAFRESVTNRVITAILIVVGASGLMSMLPTSSQVAVSRFACRAASLGLAACAPPLDLEDFQLAPARCRTLEQLDGVLPEVRVSDLVTAEGLPVRIAEARSGDAYVQLGSTAEVTPPALLDGETRGRQTVLGDVEVPSAAEWYLPRGQGLNELVAAVYDQHQQTAKRRSALALVGSRWLDPPQPLPEPGLLVSRTRLDAARLPLFATTVRPPATGTGGGMRFPTDSVQVIPQAEATVVLNRITGESAVVAPLIGRIGTEDVTGTVRWTRNAAGTVTSVLVGVVVAGRLSAGEPLGTLPGSAVAYVSVPVRTAAEQELVSRWIGDAAGFRLPLQSLLGLATPSSSDQLGSFLTRAATVTILRYAFTTPAQVQARLGAELRDGRREDWVGVRMVAASSIAPQPTGTARRIVRDPSCET